jgi:transcriptional regulator of acetoin/glycerol metabolism
MWQLSVKRGRRKGASWPISSWPIVIGRAEGCDVVVRELPNTVIRALAPSDGKRVTLAELKGVTRPPKPRAYATALEQAEQSEIERVLAQCGGRISEAARILSLHRNTLAKKIKHYGL